MMNFLFFIAVLIELSYQGPVSCAACLEGVEAIAALSSDVLG